MLMRVRVVRSSFVLRGTQELDDVMRWDSISIVLTEKTVAARPGNMEEMSSEIFK